MGAGIMKPQNDSRQEGNRYTESEPKSSSDGGNPKGIPILRCGKCKEMSMYWKKEYHAKKKEDFSWRCPNCKDLISQSTVKQVGVFK